MGDWSNTLTNRDQAYLDGLCENLSNALEKSNKPLIDAINNLAKNTGNKTTREYNELKTKYEELEKSFKKSDCLLKSIITMYVVKLFNCNYSGMVLNPDNIVKIMDQTYGEIQEHQNSLVPDALYKSIINTSNEVYEKLIRR